MRLIKITAPRGKGRDLAQLALRCGITEVSLSEAAQHRPDEAPAPRDVVNAELATPQAKAYILSDGFVPPPVGVAFSLLVGIAGALGTADDTGHRQLVGLAAASQLGVLPAWFGVSPISGFTDPVDEKLMSFGANFTAIALAATATYAVLALRDGTDDGRRAVAIGPTRAAADQIREPANNFCNRAVSACSSSTSRV